MAKRSFVIACALALAGCAAAPPVMHAASPCDLSEASYECQVERYHNVNVP
ncbi:MAG TPA: hypothetical protein VHA82_23085 [Ramlibacter sp.]|uniref:hypothetical protein n=1 Tax=Ramlibacter sp. TaxID=1917967 RepID=UPI002C643CEE|nr:hypothetical protein [Ramlibacter sp.]HVZ46710.1 hypothetical protein [Ramlibacter sp.]